MSQKSVIREFRFARQVVVKSSIFTIIQVFIVMVAFGSGYLLGISKSDGNEEDSTKIDPINQIAFELPRGWKQEKDNEDNYLSFISPDYRANPIPAIENGANIKIVRKPKHANFSLREYVISKIPTTLEGKTDIVEKTVGNTKTLNTFFCWEGCFDSYYMEYGAYVWEMKFSCAPGCSTQLEMENNKYVKDRDIFLSSFKFK